MMTIDSYLPNYVSKDITVNAKNCMQIWIGLRTSQLKQFSYILCIIFMATHYLDLVLLNVDSE